MRLVPSSFRQRINIKYFMLAFLGILLLGAAISSGAPERFLFGLAIVALYASFDLVWTRVRDRVWYVPISSLISGLVLANVGPPVPAWPMLILLPFLAVAGKQLLHLGKARHILNPAGFSLLLISFFAPVVTWWTAAMDVWTLLAVSVVGLFILWRQQRFHVAVTFLFVYALCLTGIALTRGAAVQTLPFILRSALVNGPLIFFATVMLIEPITSSFPTRHKRIAYGALVGIFSACGLLLASNLPMPGFDMLIGGLLLGNLAASLLFLPSALRPTPHLNT